MTPLEGHRSFFIVNALSVCRTQNVLGEKGRRIRELTAVVQKRFGFPEGSVEVRKLYFKKYHVGGSQPQPLWHAALRLTRLSLSLLSLSCMLRKLPPVVCVPSLRQSLCVTSCWEAWLCVGTLSLWCSNSNPEFNVLDRGQVVFWHK